VHVRNEEAGAFAAAAEAQLAGRLAACAGSCGPGNTHLIQGLYDAHRTGAPVVRRSFAYPGRKVVSMSGDGGLGMLLGELITVALHEVPVKIVVFVTRPGVP
jgi:thiamine pyrophosphate-dependent acetolactate synthase large subunit-like protein